MASSPDLPTTASSPRSTPSPLRLPWQLRRRPAEFPDAPSSPHTPADMEPEPPISAYPPAPQTPHHIPNADADANTRADANPDPDTQADANAQAQANLAPDTQADATTQAEANPDPDTQTDTQTEPDTQARANPNPDTQAEPNTQAQANPDPDDQAQAIAEATSAGRVAARVFAHQLGMLPPFDGRGGGGGTGYPLYSNGRPLPLHLCPPHLRHHLRRLLAPVPAQAPTEVPTQMPPVPTQVPTHVPTTPSRAIVQWATPLVARTSSSSK